MITTDIAKSVLFDPLEMDVNELYIICYPNYAVLVHKKPIP